jgi:hypothetical protein
MTNLPGPAPLSPTETSPTQPYGSQQPYGLNQSYAPEPKLNTFALIGFIASFFIGVVGIVFGHLALSQLKRSGEKGHGFALAGLIIGYVGVGLGIIVIAIWISFTAAVVGTAVDLRGTGY